MLFTPTAKYLSYANAASKTYAWAVYIKKTTAINEALSAGTWVNVTDKIDLDSLADQIKKIEYKVGQFTSDSIRLTARDIAWWKANILNASESQYLELKIQFTLAQGADLCTDTIYTFSGFIDKLGIPKTEIGDTVSFTVLTAQELGTRIAAENISTQYMETDIDDAATAGLILNEIPGMYVKNANISSYVLKVGVHTITYNYNTGTRQAKLDDGLYVTLAAGNNTLGNGETTAVDTERVQIYVPTLADLPTAVNVITESIIVITAGTTLPQQWYKWAGARYLLKAIFSKIGITDVTFDTLDMDVAPSPAPGVPKISFVDNPPDDAAINGKEWAICNDGTDLYVGVGHRVYKRTTSSEAYTLVATLSTGDRISKLMYNARNGHLWIFYGNTADDFGLNLKGNGSLRRLVISGLTLSSEIVLNQTTDMTWHNSIDVIDYEYTSGSWVYGVVYTDGDWNTNAGRLRLVDGSALTISTLFNGTTYGYAGNILSTINSNFLFTKNTNEVWFKGLDGIGSNDDLIKVHVAPTTGVWTSDGIILSNLDPYKIAAYHTSDDRIYYWLAANSGVQSHTLASGTTTVNLANVPAGSTMETMHYADGKAYFTLFVFDPFIEGQHRFFYGFSGNETHDFQDYPEISRNIYNRFSTFTYVSGTDLLYGVDSFGRLFQYGSKVKFYIETGDFQGEKVTDALYKIFKAFNLVGTINSHKQGKVYRRGNAAGTPQTSGNTLSITISEPSQIVEENTDYGAKVAWVEVSNGTVTYSFDGTAYGTKVLSDVRTLSNSNELIPDEIVQDVCYYTYQFFKTDMVLYKFSLGVLPLFQFEPFDNCNVTLTTTKIALTATSGTSRPIYGMKISRNCSMEVEVLI